MHNVMDTASSAPATKRVRWDESVPQEPVAAGVADSGAADGEANAVVSCSASEAIRLVSVSATTELTECNGKEGKRRGYIPDFTHQLFDKERIEGYEDGQVTIQVFYVAASLHFWVKIDTQPTDASRTADILSRLAKTLPPGYYTTDESQFLQQLEDARTDFKPPGTRVYEYKRGARTFSVYRATGEDPGVCEYHDRAQCLAPWFIEAADSIDLTDDRWEVFYLFQEETPREVLGEKWRPEALVGYFTVFGFRNPVKGVSLRICQALVLPQFQRQGHGQALLNFLYDLARSRESVFEITVEDPAPGFEKVRNLVDARTLLDQKVFSADLLFPGKFQRPSKDVVQAAHKATKLTLSQVEIGFDIVKARDVAAVPVETSRFPSSQLSSRPACTTAAATNAAATTTTSTIVSDGNGRQVEDVKRKSYRLMVKRRLLKRHGEELSSDAPTRKHQLEELYREVEGGFLRLGAKLRGGGVEQGSTAQLATAAATSNSC